MIGELWWFWALLSGIISSSTIYANQICKMPSSLMMIYRGIFMCLFLTIFSYWFEVPRSPLFWVLGVIQGLIISYVDKKTFLCSRIFGGEITASIKPFAIALILVFWWLVKPDQFWDTLNNPFQFLLTVGCVIGIVTALLMIRRTSLSKDAFILLLPALIGSIAIDINNKQITTVGASQGLGNSIFWYCWITALFSGLPNAVKFIRKRDWRLIFVPKYMIGGLLVMLGFIIANITKNTAMYYAQNPAYVTALISLYPVWIVIWNKFYYRYQKVEKFSGCDIWAVIILLISTILLVLIQ